MVCYFSRRTIVTVSLWLAIFVPLLYGCKSSADRLAEARALLESKNWEAACRIYQGFVDSGFQSAEVSINLAAARWELGERTEAMDILNDWLLVDPTDRQAHIWLGRWELQNGHRREAAGHFLSALEFSQYGGEIAEARSWLAQCKS